MHHQDDFQLRSYKLRAYSAAGPSQANEGLLNSIRSFLFCSRTFTAYETLRKHLLNVLSTTTSDQGRRTFPPPGVWGSWESWEELSRSYREAVRKLQELNRSRRDTARRTGLETASWLGASYMDRFPSMHDDDIDKLGIPKQGSRSAAEENWKSRKRARELSQLQGKLDRASEKEQQSWDRLKRAVAAGGAAAGDDRFLATGTNKAADVMREQTVGLVTAAEFRKAREAADAVEAEEGDRRRGQAAGGEAREAEEARRRKAERKKKKAAEKMRRLQKNTMSFAPDEDEEQEAPAEDEAGRGSQMPAPLSCDEPSSGTQHRATPGTIQVGTVGIAKANERAGGAPELASPPSEPEARAEDCGNVDRVRLATSKAGVEEGTRDMKGAAADGENSGAASSLRARLRG